MSGWREQIDDFKQRAIKDTILYPQIVRIERLKQTVISEVASQSQYKYIFTYWIVYYTVQYLWKHGGNSREELFVILNSKTITVIIKYKKKKNKINKQKTSKLAVKVDIKAKRSLVCNNFALHRWWLWVGKCASIFHQSIQYSIKAGYNYFSQQFCDFK